MTQSQIEKINKLCPTDQGVFVEPYGIDTKVKEPVIYLRYNTGGMKGGGYHENSYRRPYEGDGRPHWVSLDLVLEELGKSAVWGNIEPVRLLIRTADGTDNEDYYGNYDEYTVEWIVLSELEKLLTIL